ncbi:MAG: tetraacyldisaccharide 4'-kinase [Proteobacteria bacterium]|nr:tetraacyldisaccharide 4'-kinase [Pseudomonadota bacterium]
MILIKLFLSWIFGVIVYLRNFAYDRGFFSTIKLSRSVISVGNIAVGGTGKTPVVIAICEFLVGHHCRCAILTRGYKGGLKSQHWMVLVNGKRVAGNAPTDARPDEAFMQSKALLNVPVIVGARRGLAAKQWVEHCKRTEQAEPVVWILDDGFQHRQIYRDLNIVLLDSVKPFGQLMPLDRFREPPESLCRADVVMFSVKDENFPGKGDRAIPHLFNPKIQVCDLSFEYFEPVLVSSRMQEQPSSFDYASHYVAACGIANPDQFMRSLANSKIDIVRSVFKNDHEKFKSEDFLQIDWNSVKGIVTTEKDFARSEELFRSLNTDVYVRPVGVKLPQSSLDLILTAIGNS